jgi:hypothetical protein
MTMLDDAPFIAPDSHRPHGSYVKYVVERCKCEPCKAANRAYEKKRVRAMARPDEVWLPYVPAARARRHIEELRSQGIGVKTIAQLAGVPHGAISKLVYGDYGRKMPPSRRIRPATEAKILSVTVDQATGRSHIDAGPTWALLDDLIGRGYPKAWLAKRILRNPDARSLQISRTKVRASTARRVEALHRLLGDRPGPGRKSPWITRRARGDKVPWMK